MDTTKIVETLKFGNVVLPLAGGSGGVETDPTVPQYVKNISEQNIADWNGKASTSYVDTKVAELVNSAPETLDTLGELAKAIEDNKDVIEAIKVPTKTSDLINDSEFITIDDVPSVDLSGYATKDDLKGKADKSELNNYVTNEALTNKGYLTGVPSDYKTKTENDALYQSKGNYLTEIPSEYVTETELSNKGYATTTDVQNAIKDKATTNYVDTKVANLVNSAPETLDTLGEVATAIQNNASVVDALNSAIGNKVDKVSGKGLSTNDYTSAEKTKLAGLSNYDDTEIKSQINSKANKTDIPTKTSQLTNDSGFMTELTQEQLNEIVDAVIEAQKVEIVDSVEEMKDTSKQYVLSSTGTLWQYKKIYKKQYTNLFKPSEAIINQRLASTSVKDEKGYVITNVIDIAGKFGKYVRIYGPAGTTLTEDNTKIIYSTSSEDALAFIGQRLTPKSQASLEQVTENGLAVERFKAGGRNSTLNDNSTWAPIESTRHYMTISFFSGTYSAIAKDYLGTDENPNIIITLDEEIKEGEVEEWTDTGVLYSGGVSEERVEVIEKDVATTKENITKLDTRITTLEDNSETTQTEISLIPESWHSTIEEVKTKIKAKQDEFGLDAVQFIYMSDLHVSSGKKDLVYNTVRTANLIAEETNIPFVCMTGDLMSQGSYPTEAQLLAEYQLVQEYMSFVTNDKLLAVIGNHDGAWGVLTVNGVKEYYVNNINQKRMFNLAYRNQATDLKRGFNGIGLYYYVDNKPQKTRFIMLDTHYSADDSTNSDGTAVYNRFKVSSFGQEQLSWLVSEALDVPEDYNIILMGHVPINPTSTTSDHSILAEIIEKYNSRGVCEKTITFNGAYWGANVTDNTYKTVSVAETDFKNAKGKIIGYFHGHIHSDVINTSALSVPMVSIVTVGGDVRDYKVTKTNIEATFNYTNIPSLCKFIDYKAGTYTFTYDGSKWLLDGETITLGGVEKTIADCGITVTSTPTTSSVITITLEANVCRNPDNATATSFDIVTIDRAGKTIYTTRFGAGEDRELDY